MVEQFFLINLIMACVLFGVFLALFYNSYRFRFEFNYKFFLSLVPYLIFGVMLGVFSQKLAGLILSYFPALNSVVFIDLVFLLNLFLFFSFTVGLFILGLILSDSYKQISYRKTIFFGGLVAGMLIFYNIFFNNFLSVNNLILFGLFLMVVFALSLGFVLVFDKLSSYKILNDKLNFFIVFGQFFDASSSLSLVLVNSLDFNRFSLDFGLSPVIWFFAKLIFAVLICWVLDKYASENYNKKNFSRFSKLVIASVGLVLGFKNLILLSA